jgi:hypothetical protein
MASKPHTHLSRTELSDNETKKIGQFALQPPILHLCLIDRGKRKPGAQSIKNRCHKEFKNLAWNENKNEIHIERETHTHTHIETETQKKLRQKSDTRKR